MTTPKTTTSYRLTLAEETRYDVTVEASNLDAAIEIVEERWLNHKLGVQGYGFVLVLDEKGNELDEIANW
jgi:hypothetical protein